MQKLGMKQVLGVSRVTIKKSKNVWHFFCVTCAFDLVPAVNFDCIRSVPMTSAVLLACVDRLAFLIHVCHSILLVSVSVHI